MKRKIWIILALAALVCLLMSAASADTLQGHTHSWREIRRTNPTCSTSGKVWYRCNCGETKVEELRAKGHAYSAWEVTTPPTCEQEGVKTHKCSACGRVETRALAALGHDWSTAVVTKAAGYLEPGIRTYICKNDRTHTMTEEIPLKTFDRGTVMEEVRGWLTRSDDNDLVIVKQPVGGTVTVGDSYTMSVEVTGGTEPYSYHWCRKILLAQDPAYALGTSIALWTDNVVARYKESRMKTVSVFSDIRDRLGIPAAMTVQTETLTLKASEVYFNQVEGGTEQTLTTYKGGSYYCIVTDDEGRQVRSDYADVRIVYPEDYKPLKVHSEESSYAINPSVGSRKVFMNISGGIMPYTCVWTKDGKTLATSTIESVGYTVSCYNSFYEAEEAGEYKLTVTDSAMNTESDSTVVTVEDISEPLQIAEQPKGGEMKQNANYYGNKPHLMLHITMANGFGPFNYKLYWNGNYRDGKYYGSKTSFTVFDPGEYYIHVEDAVGRKIDSVKVTVTAPSN